MTDKCKARLDGVAVDSDLRSIIREQARARGISQGNYLRLVFEQRRDYEALLREMTPRYFELFEAAGLGAPNDSVLFGRLQAAIGHKSEDTTNGAS